MDGAGGRFGAAPPARAMDVPDHDHRLVLHLEDLSVGQRFVTGEHAMTAAGIITFARQFDP